MGCLSNAESAGVLNRSKLSANPAGFALIYAAVAAQQLRLVIFRNTCDRPLILGGVSEAQLVMRAEGSRGCSPVSRMQFKSRLTPEGRIESCQGTDLQRTSRVTLMLK